MKQGILKKIFFLFFLGTSIITLIPVRQAKADIPFPPCCLQLTSPSSSEIDLSWVGISSDPAVTGYMIERETPVGNGFSTIVANTPQATYKDSSLAPGTTYNYRISAISSFGISSPSNPMFISTLNPPAPLPPETPQGLTLKAVSASEIDLSWTWIAVQSTAPILGYRIERGYNNVFTTIVANSNSAATTYTDTNLAPDGTYGYRVTAINQYGTSIPSSVAYTTTLSTPGSPQNVQALAGDGQANISWRAPLTTGGGVTSYVITGGPSTTIVTGSSTLQTVILGLTNGTSYSFSISAVNVAGTSTPAITNTIVPSKIPPPQPTPVATTSSAPNAPQSTSTFVFTTTLQQGSRGIAITELQKRLISGGFLGVGYATSYFGVLTENALKSYQRAHSISAVGILGPLTRASLNAGK